MESGGWWFYYRQDDQWAWWSHVMIALRKCWLMKIIVKMTRGGRGLSWCPTVTQFSQNSAGSLITSRNLQLIEYLSCHWEKPFVWLFCKENIKVFYCSYVYKYKLTIFDVLSFVSKPHIKLYGFIFMMVFCWICLVSPLCVDDSLKAFKSHLWEILKYWYCAALESGHEAEEG